MVTFNVWPAVAVYESAVAVMVEFESTLMVTVAAVEVSEPSVAVYVNVSVPVKLAVGAIRKRAIGVQRQSVRE